MLDEVLVTPVCTPQQKTWAKPTLVKWLFGEALQVLHFAEDLKNNNKNQLARRTGSASICSVLGSTFYSTCILHWEPLLGSERCHSRWKQFACLVEDVGSILNLTKYVTASSEELNQGMNLILLSLCPNANAPNFEKEVIGSTEWWLGLSSSASFCFYCWKLTACWKRRGNFARTGMGASIHSSKSLNP